MFPKASNRELLELAAAMIENQIKILEEDMQKAANVMKENSLKKVFISRNLTLTEKKIGNYRSQLEKIQQLQSENDMIKGHHKTEFNNIYLKLVKIINSNELRETVGENTNLILNQISKLLDAVGNQLGFGKISQDFSFFKTNGSKEIDSLRKQYQQKFKQYATNGIELREINNLTG